MDQENLEKIEKILLERKGKLTEQLQGMTKEKTFNKDKIQAKWKEIGNKDEDAAVEVAQFQDDISLERNLEISLEKIEEALAKITQGAYGKCGECGGEISTERLLANPEAGKCLKCHGK